MKLSEETKQELILTLLGIKEDRKNENSFDGGVKISILQRGWIIVGEVEKRDKYFISKNSSVIRSWGTSKGIGEIALNGPTSNTKLDKCGVVKFHEMTSIAIIDCVEEKWKNNL